MKTKLLILLFASIYSINAQTTHNIGWERDITGTGNADLTIEIGDTVIWTWLDTNHTVENITGSSVETFDSGFLGPEGSTYSFTFTIEGINDYFCSVHGVASMSGTITVEPVLSIDDTNNISNFSLYPNPTYDILKITLQNNEAGLTYEIFDILGKQVVTETLDAGSLYDIDVSNWNSGLYLIKITVGDKTKTKRFVKL